MERRLAAILAAHVVGYSHLIRKDEAGTLARQGKYVEAAAIFERSLAIREKTLGTEHAHVALSLNNLAELYRDQGNYAAAEPLHQRSLAIREKVLGLEHPDVAQSLENYGTLLRDTERGELATMMELRAKAIRANHAEQNPVQ